MTELNPVSYQADAQFWQEWAVKAPEILRQEAEKSTAKSKNGMIGYGAGGVIVGALLGLATFSKQLSWTHKMFFGTAATASAGAGLFVHCTQYYYANQVGQAVIKFADELERSPEMQKELAGILQQTLTVSTVERNGVEKAVTSLVHDYAQLKVGHDRGMYDGHLANVMQTKNSETLSRA